MPKRGLWVVALAGSLAIGAGVVLSVLLLGSEESNGGADVSGGDRWRVVTLDPDAPYLPTLANQELAVGANRISFTVTAPNGLTLADLRIGASLYDLDSDPDNTVARQFATFISYGSEVPVPLDHRHAQGASLSDNARFVGAGVYVVPAFFNRAGLWGLELRIEDPGTGVVETVLFRLQVRERPSAPSVGERPPGSRTRTLADEADIRRLTSDPASEPGLYQRSIAEALAAPRPLVVIFSTPAFCHSRTCGPSLEIVKTVWRDLAGSVDAIHVEVFENPHEPDALREAPAFREWNLPSEPWIFVIDPEGIVFSRYEGTITEAELRGDLRALLSQ